MKTRIKNEQFEAVKSADLIGILWKGGEKGILLVTKEGVISMNNGGTDLTLAVLIDSKSQFLGHKGVKRDTKKVFKFENMGSLLKWFAKK